MIGSFVGPGGRLYFMLFIFLMWNKVNKMGMNRSKKRNRRIDIVFFFFSVSYVVCSFLVIEKQR